MEQLGPWCTDFREVLYWRVFIKICWKTQVCLKSDNRHLCIHLWLRCWTSVAMVAADNRLIGSNGYWLMALCNCRHYFLATVIWYTVKEDSTCSRSILYIVCSLLCRPIMNMPMSYVRNVVFKPRSTKYVYGAKIWIHVWPIDVTVSVSVSVSVVFLTAGPKWLVYRGRSNVSSFSF